MSLASGRVRTLVRHGVLVGIAGIASTTGGSLGLPSVLSLSGVAAVGMCVAGTLAMPQSGNAESLIEQARQQMSNAEWQRAIDTWTQVLVQLPDNQEAKDGLARAQAALDSLATIGQVSEDISVLRQKAEVEFEAGLNRANELLGQGDYAGAERAAITAKVKVNQARQVLSAGEFDAMTKQADALLDRISQERVTAQLVQQQLDREKSTRDKAEQQKIQMEQRATIINENLLRVRQLQLELKYDEALKVVDETLFIDPHNPAALALRDVITTAKLYRDYVEVNRRRGPAYYQLQQEGIAATIPPATNIDGPGPRSVSGLMEYPADWEELSIRRDLAAGFRESDVDRKVRLALEKTIPVDIAGSSLEATVGYLRQVTGVQIYPDWKALDLINVRPEDEITLTLGTVTGEIALERILEQLGSSEYERPQYSIEDGILVISSDQALRKRTVTIVYDIRDLLFQVPYFDNAPEFDLNAAIQQGGQQRGGQGGGGGGFGGGGGGGFGGGGGGGGTGGGGTGGGGGSIFGSPGEEPERLSREELVQQIVTIIQENVDPEGWRDLGGDTGTLQELNGNLIITNTPRNHRSIEGLLSQLRRIRALQINVEGRLLQVSMDWFEQVGVDLDIYFNTNNTMFQQARSVDSNFQLSDFWNANGTQKDVVAFDSPSGTNSPPPQGAIPGVPYANTYGTGYLFGQPTGGPPPTDITYVTGPVGTPIRQTSGFNPIGFNQQSLGTVAELASSVLSDFALTAAGSPALSLAVSYMDDIQVDLLVQATQADRRNVVLTAPRLTMFNGQRAWVSVANSITYVSNLIPATGDNSGAFQPQIGVVYDGFVLDIEGVISADRRYVTMTVSFNINSNVQFATTTVSGAAGGGGINGGRAANFEGQIQLPSLTGTQIRTTVSVPDKGTALLGGQRQVNEIEVENGVPVLSKIPWINRFFTNRLTSKEESTLLLLIRPEVIIQQENEEILFPKLSGQIGGF